MYERFKWHPLTAAEILHFLSINPVRNYRQVWSSNSSQHLVQLSRLLNCDRFEHIASYLHMVTSSEETQLSQYKLKKILSFHLHVKRRCLELLSASAAAVYRRARHAFILGSTLGTSQPSGVRLQVLGFSWSYWVHSWFQHILWSKYQPTIRKRLRVWCSQYLGWAIQISGVSGLLW